MTETFDVFLSHNSKDKPAVRELATALKTHGVRAWIDEEQLRPGRPWQEELESIIESTHAVAVLVGKDSLGPWEDSEMYACLSEFVNRKLPVIPVLLPGAPNIPKLPLFLRNLSWVDFRGGLADEGLSRLVWGITGIKPKELAQQSAAYFLSVDLENVRCFGEKQKLDLSNGNGRAAQWTVVLGDNSTGKTTLLQILGIEKLILDQDYIHIITPPILNKLRRLNCDTFTLNLTLSFGSALKDKKSANDIVTLNYEHNKDDWISTASFHNEGIACFPYGANRRLGKGSFSDNLTTATTSSLFNDHIALVNAEDWLLQADYSASKSPDKNSPLKQRFILVKEILINLLPNVEDIRISILGVNQSPRAEFKTPDGWLRLDALSLGYQTMIAWMVDLAAHMFQRYPNSPNPIAEPAVVLIDEIDLHLHPKWQRTIMAYLSERFVNTQFIVTAHSPLIVQAAENANIAVLKREGDQVVIHQQPQDVKGWRIDQLLTSDLFDLPSARSPQYEQLLEKRRKILSKASLSDADQAELKTLEEEIGDLPTAETKGDIEAMDIIRRAAEILKQAP